MKKIRYNFNEPEPPEFVKKVIIGDYRKWYYVWKRKPCNYRSYTFNRYHQIPTMHRRSKWLRGHRLEGMCSIARNHEVENGGTDSGAWHHHWTNGDKHRPWHMLQNRADFGYAIDTQALRNMRSTKHKRGWKK